MIQEKEYEQFFLLLDKVVQDTSESWQERAATLTAKSQTYGSETNLGELLSWFGGSLEG